MNIFPSRPLVIYHSGCADGFGAAYAVWKLSGDSCDYFPGVYQEDPPDVTGRQVFLVDFSYKRPVLEKLAETAACVMVLDHHASANADLAPYQRERGQPPSAGLSDKIEVVFDQSRSGAVIAWEWFNPDTEIPDLLLYIQDRDLWKFDLPHSREISMALHSYPQDFAVWDTLMDQTERLYHEGIAIKRWYDKALQSLLKTARRLVIGGFTVPAVNANFIFSSDLGNLLSEGEPFAAVYVDGPKGRTFSLRSSKTGMNVAEIAERYGGGGHVHAAGFQLPYGAIL